MLRLVSHPGLLTLATVVGWLGLIATTLPASPVNQRSPLGMNIADLRHWTAEWTLIDVMKQARHPWLTQCNPYTQDQCQNFNAPDAQPWNTREQDILDLDEHGWVRSLPAADEPDVHYRSVATLLLGKDVGHPAGEYIVRYKGSGTLEYGQGARLLAASSQPGRHVLAVDPSRGSILLKITATDPEGSGDYLRDIAVIMPGGICNDDPFHYAATRQACETEEAFTPFEAIYQQQRFHPLFLDNLRPFRVIRFMGMLNTMNAPVVDWADRARLDDASWATPRGAPPAVALDLALRLQADPWLNMPTRVNDRYIRQFAELALKRLSPEQQVYLEYGNEIWNTAFPAGQWLEAQALTRWPDNDIHPHNKRLNAYAHRAVEACQIWRTVWGEQAHRIQCVLGGIAANPWATEQILQCPLWTAETDAIPCGQLVDAVAIAPYFGGYLGRHHGDTLQQWAKEGPTGLDTLFQEIFSGGVLHDPSIEPAWKRAPRDGALAQAGRNIRRHRELADDYDLDLIAYEGGQHLVGVGADVHSTALTDFLNTANRDPRMKEAYQRYLRLWREAGGQLLLHHTSVGQYSRWGSWGAKEYQQQSADAPKHRALMDFITANPCWWLDCEGKNNTSPSGQE